MTKFFIIIIILFYNLFGQNLKSTIINFQETKNLKNAQWSLYAKYVDNGHVIITHNETLSLTPASGLKLFTAATALDILGSDFKFTTRLLQSGSITNGILKGDLIIQGGGDPTLGSSLIKGALPLDSLMMQWTDAVKKHGIRQINGNIIANSGLYNEQIVPDYWNWLNLGNYFATGAGALNINDNLYYLVFHPGKVGELAQVLRTEPEIPGLSFTNYMFTGKKGSGDNGYIYCAPNQYNATLRGSIPAGRKEFRIKGSIPNPALFAARYFKNFLEGSGIAINGTAITERSFVPTEHIIYTTTSPSLKEILSITLKQSNNLFAEGIGKMAGYKSLGSGSNDNTVKAVEKFLKKNNIDTDQLDLFDACGLSPVNLISAKMMVDLLIAMTSHPEFNTFYNSMAVAGNKDDTGSFRNWGNAPVNARKARIKSGLIKHVRSHSGYVKDTRGRLIAFSFIANNFQGSYHTINSIHKQLLIKLAELK